MAKCDAVMEMSNSTVTCITDDKTIVPASPIRQILVVIFCFLGNDMRNINSREQAVANIGFAKERLGASCG